MSRSARPAACARWNDSAMFASAAPEGLACPLTSTGSAPDRIWACSTGDSRMNQPCSRLTSFTGSCVLLVVKVCLMPA